MQYRKVVIGVGAAGIIAGTSLLPNVYAAGRTGTGPQYSLIREVAAKSVAGVTNALKKLRRGTTVAARVLNDDGWISAADPRSWESEKQDAGNTEAIAGASTRHTHEGEMTEPQNRRGPPLDI